MARLLIVWHSRTGGSRQMAEAALTGANGEDGGEAVLLAAAAAGPADFLSADGYLFAGPENLAALSGEMKALLDRCYYPLLGRIEARPYAHLICAGSDGANAARQLARIVTGWRLKPIQPPLIVNTDAASEADILAQKTIASEALDPCRALGAAFMAGLVMGVY